MQFRDLQRQYAALKPVLDKELSEVMSSGLFVMGDKVVALERQLASYIGTDYCVSCGSGTDALYLALRVWNIGPGDAVFVPDFTFFASAEVVSLVGAVPVFVDVDADTFNMSPIDLQAKIDQVRQEGILRPRVVLTVDLFGRPADYGQICPIAAAEGLWILEDSAQGFGSALNGKRTCSFGDIAITSFFPSKPLGCYGDGGAIYTNNAEWAALCQSYRQHGKGNDKYDNVRIGINSRLDALQAAVLLAKLDIFEQEMHDSQRIAERYNTVLMDRVGIPSMPKGCVSSWAQYTVRFRSEQERDECKRRLDRQGIPAHIYYPTPLHRLPVYRNCQNDEQCPNAVRLSQTVLSLPMHPYLTDEEIEIITANI